MLCKKLERIQKVLLNNIYINSYDDMHIPKLCTDVLKYTHPANLEYKVLQTLVEIEQKQ